MSQKDFISVATVIKTQGNRGELAADILTDFPERFTELRQVLLQKEGTPTRELKLDSHWFHKRRVILKFEGIDDIDSASELVGYDVCIERNQLMPLEAHRYYQHDLVGCLLQTTEGLLYGTVVEVLGGPGQYLLKVRSDAKDLLVPFADSYFQKIDVQGKLLICNLPDGLEAL